MKKVQRSAIPLLLGALFAALCVVLVASKAQASATSFHFEFAADSRGNYTVLPDFSHKMVSLNPVFGFFAGDLCSTFDTTCINNQWKPAMDGNSSDGMLAKTFVSRGNHDSGTLSAWQGLWDFAGMGTRVGATHYTAQSSDATYSFDYGNSHFAVVDNPSRGAAGWTSTQISWLDADLTAAEGRGEVHEFLIVHGPMYTVTTEHASDLPSSALKAVINKHPRLIGLHGHEHVTAYTLVTPSFESGITSFPQFTMGRAGAPAYPVSKPVTWSANQNAFADVAISGTTVTVKVYSQSGSVLYTKSFSHAAAGPTPTPGAGSTGTATYTTTAAYDGYILETSETSGAGGTTNATGTTFRVGDNASNYQYRGILSFNTAGLPDNAVISSVTLKIKQAGSGGSNPFGSMGNIVADIKTGALSGSNSLQSGDFQASASKNAAVTITNNPSSGWYSANMSSTNFSYINKAGVTQLRLRFSTDDNNNHVADYLSFYTGEATTTANRATLTIKYSVP
jgi:hypothetical protein